MITSAPNKTVLVENVRVTGDTLIVDFDDGRSVSLPLAWYPRLQHGSSRERNMWKPSGAGRGIHWPLLDEDLSAEVIMPLSPEFYLMKFNQLLQSGKLSACEPVTAVEPNRIQPKLGRRGVALDVYVHGFIAITGIEVKTVRSDDLDRRHKTKNRKQSALGITRPTH
jgi:hypothetical protein